MKVKLVYFCLKNDIKDIFKIDNKQLHYLYNIVIMRKRKTINRFYLLSFIGSILVLATLVFTSCGILSVSNGQKEKIKDIEGNSYNTVKIGNQTWMAENLRTRTYNDGTNIPNVFDDDEWSNLDSGAYVWYDNDESNGEIYGALYNWYAVETGKLCPRGWHVPTDEEWTELIDYLATEGHDGKEGSALKASYGWHDEGYSIYRSFGDEYGTDDFGFTALPAGGRGIHGGFHFLGDMGRWWSATEYSENIAGVKGVRHNTSEFDRSNSAKEGGFSIRCIKDRKSSMKNE